MSSHPPISKETLLDSLHTKRAGKNLFVFDSIDSTNICAMTLAATDAPDGTTVWADFQTGGKGRLGRRWVGEPGKNVMMSVVLRSVPDEARAFLPYIVCEAVASGVDRVCSVRSLSKWPNDLMLEERKFAGILIEASQSGAGPFAVAGIGINANQTDFPDEIGQKATSLCQVTGRTIDRVSLFSSVMSSLEEVMEKVRGGDARRVVSAWEKRCVTLGSNVRIQHGDKEITGTAIGLESNGGLMVESDGQREVVFAGDIQRTSR